MFKKISNQVIDQIKRSPSFIEGQDASGKFSRARTNFPVCKARGMGMASVTVRSTSILIDVYESVYSGHGNVSLEPEGLMVNGRWTAPDVSLFVESLNRALAQIQASDEALSEFMGEVSEAIG